jgi:hypothetical protein
VDRRASSLAVLALIAGMASGGEPELTQAIRHDVSQGLDLHAGRFTPRTPRSASEIANRFPTPPDPLQQISLGVQRAASGLRTPEPLLLLPGLDALEAGRLVPADPVLDVGPAHLLLWVNAAFAIHDRHSGQRLAGPVAGNAIWAGFGGPCEYANEGDPLVVYDDFAGRWVLSQMAISAQRQCVAVSTGSDPFGPYARYEFAFPLRNDFAKLAVWTDGAGQSAYLLSVHEFSGSNFAGSSLVALERDAMLAGQPARMLRYAGLPEYGIQPVHLDGPDPAVPGSCAPFVHFALPPFPSGYRFWHLCPDWSPAGQSQLSGPVELPADRAFVPHVESVPQPGNAPGLPSFGAYTLYRASARRLGPDAPEALSLAITHTVRAGPAQGALRWTRFELEGDRISASGFGDAPRGRETLAARITDSGSYAPDSNTRFLGATALDASGNLAIGYHVSGPWQNPTLRRSGRRHHDPAGLLQDEAACAPASTAAQTASHGRFGDYVSLSIDPLEQCTAYFAGQYIPTDSGADWATHICAWRQPGCGEADFGLAPAAVREFEFCGRDQPQLDLPYRIGALSGFRGTASLAFQGPGAPALVDAPTEQPIPGGGRIRLGRLDQLDAGQYTLTLTAMAADRSRSQSWALTLWQPLATAPELLSPAADASEVRWRPELRFAAQPGARTYRIEVAADPDFAALVDEAMLRETTWQPNTALAPQRRYWWRVRAENACGVSPWSPPRSFTTRPEGCMAATALETVVALDFAKDEAGFVSLALDGPAFERTQAPGSGLDGMVYGVPNAAFPALSRADSPAWTLPTDLSGLRLRLAHSIRLESAGSSTCIDGARLEWSLDDGGWQAVPASAFDRGGPDGRSGPSHPLAGDLWCRSGRLDSVVDLSAASGRRLRLRLAVGSVGYGNAPPPNGYWLGGLTVDGCRAP